MIRTIIWRLFSAATLLSLLYGCQLSPLQPEECCDVSGPVADPETAWQTHQQQVSELNVWQLDGKLGIRSSAESGSLRLRWEQQDDQYQISANDPIGRQLADLQGSAKGVILSQGDQQFYAQTPEALFHAQLGWPLPVSNLLYWVRGLPAPGEITALGLNEMGQLSLLEQQGWQLTFDQYRTLGHYPALPTQINAHHPGHNLRLKLIIYSWQID